MRTIQAMRTPPALACAVFGCLLGCGGSSSTTSPIDAGGGDATDATDEAPVDGARWAAAGGDGSGQLPFAIAVDSTNDDVVVGGETSGRLSFGALSVAATAGVTANAFLAGFDRDGHPRFLQLLGGATGEQAVRTIAIVGDGTFWAGGFFSGVLTCGSQTLTSLGASDAWIGRFSSADGASQGCVQLGGEGHQSVTALRLGHDAAGSATLVVAGEFAQAIDPGLASGPLLSAGEEDLFVATFGFGPGGLSLAAKTAFRFGGPDVDRLPRLTLVHDVDPVVAAIFRGPFDVGGKPLPDNFDAMLLARFHPDGSVVFAEGFVADKQQSPVGIATTSAGDVVVTGSFVGQVDFGGGALASESGEDAFVALFDENGGHVASRRMGGFGPDVASDVVAHADGRLDVVGYFSATLEGMTAIGANDVFLARLDPSLKTSAVARFGDLDDQRAYRAAASTRGLVATGSFFGHLDFGTAGTVVSSGGFDPAAGDVWVASFP